MESFEEIFSDDNIIRYLCKVRVKLADQRSKRHSLHLLTSNRKYNYHKEDGPKLSVHEDQYIADLKGILPPRKKWINMGEKWRYRSNSRDKLTSAKKNALSLERTIDYYRKHCPQEPFVIALNRFIGDVGASISNPMYKISKPVIVPRKKNKKEAECDGKLICRPIAMYSLKDSLILSMTNKYLTNIFDKYFEGCSLAFRASKNSSNSFNHHVALNRIMEYKSHYVDEPLWVVECDMKKFYDTVNHKYIINKFNRLLKRAQLDCPHISYEAPKRLFNGYLNSYCFNKDVNRLGGDGYWNYNKPGNGRFEWVDKELVRLKYYRRISKERIGVPQGGALSGLIANIVLDDADKQLKNYSNELFYIRYCDDMILMSPSKKVAAKAKKVYLSSLKTLKLVPHDFALKLKEDRASEGKIIGRDKGDAKMPPISLKPFWKKKSKGPYKWCEYGENGYPWVGFVGYEIRYDRSVRVRKSSLLKELDKQRRVVKEIIDAIHGSQRVNNAAVMQSAINRMIGMSVGLVKIWNYATINSELCWKNGFQKLNNNRFSRKQLSLLDRNRDRLYSRLSKYLRRKGEPVVCEKTLQIRRSKDRQIVDYNKPFSYYHQTIGRLPPQELFAG